LHGGMAINSILVVEDNEIQQRMYSKAIPINFHVNPVFADNLEHALALVRSQSFDLYITDGRYPLSKAEDDEYKHAWEAFTKRVRELDPAAKIILITGGKDLDDITQRLGVDYQIKGEVDWPGLAKKYLALK